MIRNLKIENLLINIVNSIFNVDIQKRNRKEEVVNARRVFFKILHDFGYSKTDIAACLRMHHATIIHSLKDVDYHLKNNPLLMQRYNLCKEDFDYHSKEIYDADKLNKLTHEDILRSKMVTLKIENDALKKEINSLHSEIREFGQYAPLIRIIKDRVHKNNVEAFRRKLYMIANGV
jgi:hypothetical protein